MANFNIHTVTAAGAQLHAAALAEGKTIRFTHIAVGDGAAPAAPETAAALTHLLFHVPVSSTLRDPAAPSQTIVRGAYVNTGGQANFYQRELGIFAEISGENTTPILYAYFNAGDTADFIPAVESGSIVQQSLNLSVITGAAAVLYATDPLAPATMADLTEAQTNLQAIVNEFTETKIQELRAVVSELDGELTAAREDLERHAADYVNRAGDTMTGDLTLTNGARVRGSADLWNGWTLYTSLQAVAETLTPSATLTEICAAMVPGSVLMLDVATPHAAAPLPAGLLEIRRSAGGACTAQFTDGSGLIFSAAAPSGGPATAWHSALGAAPGQGGITFAAVPPLGWLACNGAAVSRTTYAALFAAIGTTYGSGDGSTTFNLPDTRGLFLRGLDEGKGIDADRTLGSVQQSAVPNITGVVGALAGDGAAPTGAFYRNGRSGVGRVQNSVYTPDPTVYMSAAASSNVYKAGVKEARPINLPVIHIIKY